MDSDLALFAVIRRLRRTIGLAQHVTRSRRARSLRECHRVSLRSAYVRVLRINVSPALKNLAVGAGRATCSWPSSLMRSLSRSTTACMPLDADEIHQGEVL